MPVNYITNNPADLRAATESCDNTKIFMYGLLGTDCTFEVGVRTTFTTNVYEWDATTEATDTTIILKAFDWDNPAIIIFQGEWNHGEDPGTDAPISFSSTEGITWADVAPYLSGNLGNGNVVNFLKKAFCLDFDFIDDYLLTGAYRWAFSLQAFRTPQVSNIFSDLVGNHFYIRNEVDNFLQGDLDLARELEILSRKRAVLPGASPHTLLHNGVVVGNVTLNTATMVETTDFAADIANTTFNTNIIPASGTYIIEGRRESINRMFSGIKDIFDNLTKSESGIRQTVYNTTCTDNSELETACKATFQNPHTIDSVTMTIDIWDSGDFVILNPVTVPFASVLNPGTNIFTFSLTNAGANVDSFPQTFIVSQGGLHLSRMIVTASGGGVSLEQRMEMWNLLDIVKY